MKKIRAALALALTTGLFGCRAPQPDADKHHSDEGWVLSHETISGKCRILVLTDYYGVHLTGDLNPAECAEYRTNIPVMVVISAHGEIRILGLATP